MQFYLWCVRHLPITSPRISPIQKVIEGIVSSESHVHVSVFACCLRATR